VSSRPTSRIDPIGVGMSDQRLQFLFGYFALARATISDRIN